MKRLILPWVAVLLLPGGAGAVQEVSYEMLARSATEHSKELLLHELDMKIDKAKADTVRAEYFPTVSLGFNNEYNKDLDGSSTGVETVGDSLLTSGTRYQSSLSLGLNYELYHFGVTERKIAIADQETELKRLKWCTAEQELHAQILEHYGSALKAQSEIALKSQMLTLQREAYGQKKRLYLAGRFSKIDLGEAAMSVLELERGIEERRQQFHDDMTTLEELSYMRIDGDEAVLLPLEITGEGLEAIPFDETAEGMRLQQGIRQKEMEIAMFKRSQLPSVSFYSNYYLYGSDPDGVGRAMDAMGSNSWKAGIGIRMTLFEGFKYFSENERLMLELQRLKEEHALREREHDFDSRMRTRRVAAYEVLEGNHERLLDETDYVATMAGRLREHEEIDAPSYLEKRIEMLQRRLNVQIKRIDASLETAALELQYRGADRCSLR